jgi:hypothetical protein
MGDAVDERCHRKKKEHRENRQKLVGKKDPGGTVLAELSSRKDEKQCNLTNNDELNDRDEEKLW